MPRLASRLLPDGRRLHLLDGPIELVIEAWGSADEVAAAYAAATGCAAAVLDALCAELPLLRSDARLPQPDAQGPVAIRMQRAVSPFAARGTFITPMAAVAGAVAEQVLEAMCRAAPLRRAYVNNGGDIALHLEPGEALRAGIARPGGTALLGEAEVRASDPVRGIATSGWPGRSFSLGIADAVTVLARSASEADAAATVVANAVDLPRHPAVTRVPAREAAPDSDLGDRPVTRGVGPLTEAEVAQALDRGTEVARSLLRDGLVAAVALCLAGKTRVVSAGGVGGILCLQAASDAGGQLGWPGSGTAASSARV